MKRKMYVFYILIFVILAAAGLLLFFHITRDQPGKTVDQFLHSVRDDGQYESFLSPELSGHPFISLFRDEGTGSFRVVDTETLQSGIRRIYAVIRFADGEVKAPFEAEKADEHWRITKLPDVRVYSHSIPVSKSESDKGLINWVFDIGRETIEARAFRNTEIHIGKPVSMSILNGIIVSHYELQPVVLTRVISLTNSRLEDMKLGYFSIEGDFPVFMEQDSQFIFTGSFGIPIGTRDVTLYRTNDGIGQMAIYKKSVPMEGTIRVILQNSKYDSLLHPKIEITCKGPFKVRSVVNSIELQFDEGDIAVFEPSGEAVTVYRNGTKLASSIFRWYIASDDGSRLTVKNIARYYTGQNGTPYRGILEVAAYNGQLTLINEVDLEEYLYSVVPSEMPVKFGLEALKVQAIAARSYAVRAINASGYRVYGAHLDDSTSSQVYNNVEEQEVATSAVDDTSGIIPVYSDEPVDTRFFSTSCGYTASFHEVWSSKDNEFPSKEVPYLTAKPQYEGNSPSLYNEENFRAFINNTELPGYDRFSPFFRWNVTMTREQLEASLNKNLSAIYKQQPLFVLTRVSEGVFESMDIPHDIGSLLNIEVAKRGAGGNIMELVIATSRGVFKIIKEYNVRQVLRPVNYLSGYKPMELNCHDGSVRKDFPLLPSAFAYIDFNRDIEGNILDIIITGGGYGHGVGMSQFGTYGLTLLGKSYEQIIEHYYPGSKLVNIYAGAADR